MVEKSNVPEIRFAGFADPWEQRKLGELFSYGGSGGTPSSSNDSFYGGKIPFLGISDVKGRDISHTAKHITENGLAASAAWVVPSGAVCLAMYASVGKVGIIRQNTATSQAFFNMVFDNDGTRDFVYSRLERAELTTEWESLISTGTQRNLNANKVRDFMLAVPAETEQRLIGSLFARLDSLITLHQRKYDKLGELKKSLLEKMFPKEGEVFPEIRFAGFADPWEQRKLGELADSFEYGLNVPASDFDGIHKYLRITDIDDETHRFNESDLTSPLTDLMKCEQYRLAEGDLLFARTGASVGKTYLYQSSDGLAYYAGFLIRAHIHDDASADFVFQSTLTERYRRFVSITSQRSGQPGINAKEYSEYEVPTPSLSEQRLIGRLFSRLDALITLHQRKLELLRNIKKALLDKMFVEGE